VPSLAVAAELTARGASVAFAGTADRIEARLVPAAGYALHTFPVTGLPRRPSPALVRGLGLAGLAPARCIGILRAVRPDVVFGGGGYVAGPMLAAAGMLRIPAALLEVDAHLGLANRLGAPFARRVFLSFPIPGKEPPRYQVTGRPIPRAVLDATAEEGRREFDLPADRPVVLVFGGSLGSTTINRSAAAAWAKPDPGFTVVHVTPAGPRRTTGCWRGRLRWGRSSPPRTSSCRGLGDRCSRSPPRGSPRSSYPPRT
jgi:UDP-N-acetylglucosamine--N-acetylmuramyl-(pentapeptide) pyrophosphoryl-undecaprenol N-acetylglucosamine transferase